MKKQIKIKKTVTWYDETALLNARGDGHEEYEIELNVWQIEENGKIRFAGNGNENRKEITSLPGYKENDFELFTKSLIKNGFTVFEKNNGYETK